MVFADVSAVEEILEEDAETRKRQLRLPGAGVPGRPRRSGLALNPYPGATVAPATSCCDGTDAPAALPPEQDAEGMRAS